jgi:hypothetical protein
MKLTRMEENTDLINSFFGVILLPLLTNRRELLNRLEKILSQCSQLGIKASSKKIPITGTLWCPKS